MGVVGRGLRSGVFGVGATGVLFDSSIGSFGSADSDTTSCDGVMDVRSLVGSSSEVAVSSCKLVVLLGDSGGRASF